jgi:hypothetical protein
MTRAAPNSPPLRHVVTWSAAYDYCHDRYQAYYLAGLTAAAEAAGVPVTVHQLQRLPGVLRALRRVRSSYRLTRLMKTRLADGVDGIARLVGGNRTPPSGVFHPLVGQYVFEFEGGKTVRLAVDAQDSGELALPDAGSVFPLYAKTNYHADGVYPEFVIPECNGNPLILDKLPELTASRTQPAEYDVCCVVRVWGGQDEEEGVEHNLRLLEAVNKANVRKYLLAYLVTGDIDRQEARLRAQGIPTTRQPMPLQRLWQVSASSRINIIRLGMHNCVPWRYMDMLAMGTCVVFDQPPQTVWPVPLEEGKHYLHLGLLTPRGQARADDARYTAVPELLTQYVCHASLVDAIRSQTAAYFDQHAHPAAVGRRLLSKVLDAVRGSRSTLLAP